MKAVLVVAFLFANGEVKEKTYPMRTWAQCVGMMKSMPAIMTEHNPNVGYYKLCTYVGKKKKRKKPVYAKVVGSD